MVSGQRRIVVKIGGSTLTTAGYALRQERFQVLVKAIAQLSAQGYSPVLISSGAIPTGHGALHWAEYPTTIPEKQAAAAVGQGALMHLYEQQFALHQMLVAQLLVTKEDFQLYPRLANIRNTLDILLQHRVIPIVNENDTVAVDEIKVGDNDTLGALIATAIQADCYIILSDVDGLYTANPRQQADARLITQVEEITSEIEAASGGIGSIGATGGMRTKIAAARIATAAGVEVVIANGEKAENLLLIVQGAEIGTRFQPQREPVPSTTA